MATTYIDVTELLASGLHTGIQRVVRQIARGGMVGGRKRLSPVVAYGGRFHALNKAGIAALCGPVSPSAATSFRNDGAAMRVAKHLLGAVPSLYDWVQVRYFRRKMMRQLGGLFDSAPLILDPNDRVVLLDSFWGGSTALEAARRARRSGCAVVAVIYDMIPVTHPQFHDARLVRLFRTSINLAGEVCSGFVTISKYCQEVVEQFFAAKHPDVPVGYFYLGADLSIAAPEAVSEPPFLVGAPKGGRVHLVIGTIEPRKGCATVLNAFDRLWQAGREDQLVIIGKIGWHVDHLMYRLNDHPELGRRLFLIHNANDAMLEQAFDAADAAIMASTVEGFGLPLVEALYRKLPVIASDIPVFREIAGGAALYFHLDDDRDLARAVVEMEDRSVQFQQAAVSFKWINWSQAVEQFHDAVDKVVSTSLKGSAYNAVKG